MTSVINKVIMSTESSIRPATQANRFYDGDPTRLSEEVDHFLARHEGSESEQDVAAIIVPHAGYYYSGNVAAKAYMQLNPEKPLKRIFLLGPSHHAWLNGASVNTQADFYATPLGQVKVDQETARQLTEADEVFTYQEEVHAQEHCLEVQLPFLQRRLGEVPPIVPIVIATNDFGRLKQIAAVLRPFFNKENLFVISSDFSHYPCYEDAISVDGKTGKAIESGDVNQLITTVEANAASGIKGLATSACGLFPIVTLMLMLDRAYEVRHLLYQNSGDIERQSRDRVVGYHAFSIVRKADQQGDDFLLTDEDKQQLKRIAAESIKAHFDGKEVDSKTLSNGYPTLQKLCGAFVSLHKNGRLRGCIGHFGEDTPLHEIVAEMARAAAFEDPRFLNVTREEFDDLEIEISVLTPMRRIYSLDEFELHRHGIYIRKGFNSGTYLPQVADEVNWTKEEFVSHCSQDKARLGWDGWKEAELYVYEAIVF